MLKHLNQEQVNRFLDPVALSTLSAISTLERWQTSSVPGSAAAPHEGFIAAFLFVISFFLTRTPYFRIASCPPAQSSTPLRGC